jgi:light-regulated signal transduction histidine kinase (bacteriophytochrome)
MEPRPDPAQRDLVRVWTLAAELAEFSSRAGHDLVGPLNQASSLLSLFVQKNQCEPESEAAGLMEFLQYSSARMERVVAGVRPYLQIAAASPRRERVDGNAALAVARERLAPAILEVSAAIESETLPEIEGDSDQICMLFEMLLGNSIRFRRPGEPARIRVSCSASDGDWVFQVEDEGIGIEPNYHQTVFQPFRRLHGKEYPGAGMGLTTARLIVGLHSGRIWIEPGRPVGTAVKFTVPALASSAAEPSPGDR